MLSQWGQDKQASLIVAVITFIFHLENEWAIKHTSKVKSKLINAENISKAHENNVMNWSSGSI